jgi:hypothetical protein
MLNEYRMSNSSTDEWSLMNTECLILALTNEAPGIQNA